MNISQIDSGIIDSLPEAALLIDPLLNVVLYGNSAASRLLRIAEKNVFPKVSRLFHKSLPQLISFSNEVEEQGFALSDELIAVTEDGREIELEVSATKIIFGEKYLLNICLRDREKVRRWRMKSDAQKYHRFGLLEWERIHQVFQNIEKENQLILSAAGEGIYGVDADGSTTFINPAAERMLHWEAEELIGRNIHAAIHHSHEDGSDYHVCDCPIYAAFKDGTVHKVKDEVFWTKSGKAISVEYTSTPILDNGHLVGAVVVFRDISDRVDAENQLRTALEEVKQLKQKLELENAYLQEEINEDYNFHQIIGKTPVVQRVVKQIQLVAPTSALVMITGESGTGKELVARAIHYASERKDRPLIRVNCAAIPQDLFESEFFGHVKGAFSGAVSDRLGRFEVADGGTLFLDEVGEIPLALQGKLLRALQDMEFERVGESQSRRVDVRVIAATNRNLQESVAGGEFREDLYFRLNVFPIPLAPLRDRRGDIPLLVRHFLERICKRYSKSNLVVSVRQMLRLQAYSWPGNIRELQNILERQVILSTGDKLVFEDFPEVKAVEDNPDGNYSAEVLTDSDCKNIQMRTIVNALKKSQGRIYGSEGAAVLLGVKPTTLASRIKKFGIDKNELMSKA